MKEPIRFIVLIFTFVLIVGCGNSEDEYNISSKFHSDEIQSRLLSELENAEIPYKVDHEGKISYSNKHQIVFEALTTYILQEEINREQKKYGFGYEDGFDTTAFVAFIHTKGISTDSIVVNEIENSIYWGKEVNDHINKYLESFFIEYAKQDIECDKAKLSYLLERTISHEDKYAFQFALELGADPNGVGEKLSIECFAGMPTGAPVLSAVQHKDIYMLKTLLEHGASANAACCDATALALAKELKNKEAVKLLKEYGAE